MKFTDCLSICDSWGLGLMKGRDKDDADDEWV